MLQKLAGFSLWNKMKAAREGGLLLMLYKLVNGVPEVLLATLPKEGLIPE